MPTFREIRFAERKEEIINRSAEIFLRKGYEKTTLEEIAAELKVTKGSLYHYFKGKEDILFQSLMRAHCLANEALSDVVGKKELSPSARLTLAITEHTRVLTQRFVYASLRQQDLLLPEKWRRALLAERDKFQQMLTGIIQEGMDDGSFRSVDLKMVSFAILGAMNWVARWYSPDGEHTPEQIADAMADYLVGGLLT